jgi:hypothetical protein
MDSKSGLNGSSVGLVRRVGLVLASRLTRLSSLAIPVGSEMTQRGDETTRRVVAVDGAKARVYNMILLH